MHIAIAGRAREAGEVYPVAAGNRMPAVGLVGAVLADEMEKVLAARPRRP